MKKIIFVLLFFNTVFLINAQVPVYLYFGSHNETNDQQYHNLNYSDSADYATMKEYIQQVCDTIIFYNAKYEMMLESNFILACLQNENAYTNPNDIIEWADKTAQIEVQPHNHFKASGIGANPYNYADLAYLLDSCGLTDTCNVMGGFIWRSFTNPPVSEDWTQWQVYKAGNTFPFYKWHPKFIWGGGSPNHISDYEAYGIWKPQAATTSGFGIHDTSKVLINFGNCCGSAFLLADTSDETLLAYRIMNFADSVNLHFASNPNAFFNLKVMMNFRNFPSTGFAAKLGTVLRTIKPYINSGEIQYKGIEETYQTWLALHPNPSDYFATKCVNTVSISSAMPAFLTVVKGNNPTENEFKIYPSPCREMLTVALKNTKATSLKVVNLLGEVILSKEVNITPEAVIQFDLSSIPPGLYLISCGASILKFSKQ